MQMTKKTSKLNTKEAKSHEVRNNFLIALGVLGITLAFCGAIVGLVWLAVPRKSQLDNARDTYTSSCRPGAYDTHNTFVANVGSDNPKDWTCKKVN